MSDGVRLGAGYPGNLVSATKRLDDFISGHFPYMTDGLSQCNRISGGRQMAKTANLPDMEKPDPHKVARRLRAVMRELQLETVDDLAAYVGGQRSAVSNWLNGYNFPTVPSMAVLCEKRKGLTLDWLYLGIEDALPVALAVKMKALMEGVPIPGAAAPMPEQAKAKPKPGRPSQARRKTAIETA